MNKKFLRWMMWAWLILGGEPMIQAQTNLHSFSGSDGSYPAGGLVYSGGILYGTASSGGSGSGTVFAIQSNGTSFGVLHSFGAGEGANPSGQLLLSGSTLYGTCSRGGSGTNGTLFAINTDGTGFTMLHNFATNNQDGTAPQGGLTLSDGMLYGTTRLGGREGSLSRYGTLYAINTNGSGFKVLHTFSYGTDGGNPSGGVIVSGGRIYGMASNGGNNSSLGAVYAVNTDGTGFQSLHSFTGVGTEGIQPGANLTLFGGTLYGTTLKGGTTGKGTVFALNTDGTGFTTLHSFTGADGESPAAGMIVSGNALYGTTDSGGNNGSGTIYSIVITATGAAFKTMQSFSGMPSPSQNSSLCLVNNTLYGANFRGGSSSLGGIYKFGPIVPVVDITKPTLTITNPVTSGLRWSNETFTVSGKVADNVAVSGIYYRLNGLAWMPAIPAGSGWNTPVLTLQPGTNFIAAYAVDTSTNYSITNVAQVNYIPSAILTVNLTGSGTVAPNYNNALLQLGASYSLTAKAGAGFVFTNWTDGDGNILTNKPALKFVMVSNLVLNANFADTSPPTLTITSIPFGGRVSNEVFTVTGSTADNVGVAHVFYRLTNSLTNTAWLAASTDDNFATWSAFPDLTPGNNTLAAYAVDTSSHFSTTNTVKLFYVVSGMLTVNVNGSGIVSPNYNGAFLQISNQYSMTATQAAGFKFTGWTDGSNNLVTRKPALKFLMVSNLFFTANFLDTNLPTLNITNTPPYGKVSNEMFTVIGTAADNVAVTQVFYLLTNGHNNTNWLMAGSSDGFATWSADLDLASGTNVLAAYAVDASTNISAIRSVRLVYVVSDRLTVSTNGLGSITPDYNGALLEISNRYSMTAKPEPGFKFTGWTDSSNNLVTQTSTLKFQMASNLSFTANFLDTNPPTLQVMGPTGTSNEFYTAYGTAKDNVGVANVFYQLNHSTNWYPAILTNGTLTGSTNWSATLELTPGTNYFAAYAVDTSSNLSRTNVVKFVYTTAPASLRGMKGLQFTDTAGAFSQYSFGVSTFGSSLVVGDYTYTKSGPTKGRLIFKNTAPPQYVGNVTNDFIFTAPNTGQVSGVGSSDTAFWTFAPVPNLVPTSILNQKVLHIDTAGFGLPVASDSTFYTAGRFIVSNLVTGATNLGTTYTYTRYGPLTAMIKQALSNETSYITLTFYGTNNGASTRQFYHGSNSLDGGGLGLFGLTSIQPGNYALTNLSGRSALVSSAGNTFRLTFPDDTSFMQRDPVGDALTNGVGNYAYILINSNTSSLTLNYTDMPQTNFARFQFIAPNFATFTNADGTVGASAFK